jgi:hypothetical protein
VPTNIPCVDCHVLVGAGPIRQPHAKLVPVPNNAEGKKSFRCGACQCRWSVGALGWSRLID